jgi:hypothetical protein
MQRLTRSKASSLAALVSSAEPQPVESVLLVANGAGKRSTRRSLLQKLQEDTSAPTPAAAAPPPVILESEVTSQNSEEVVVPLQVPEQPEHDGATCDVVIGASCAPLVDRRYLELPAEVCHSRLNIERMLLTTVVAACVRRSSTCDSRMLRSKLRCNKRRQT